MTLFSFEAFFISCHGSPVRLLPHALFSVLPGFPQRITERLQSFSVRYKSIAVTIKLKPSHIQKFYHADKLISMLKFLSVYYQGCHNILLVISKQNLIVSPVIWRDTKWHRNKEWVRHTCYQTKQGRPCRLQAGFCPSIMKQ